jgi:hypothetical protein
MKKQMIKLALVAITALLLNVGWVMADTTVTQPASTGTPSGSSSDVDKKGQDLNSASANQQRTASMPAGTKKHHKKPKGAAPVANQSPAAATKTPQVVTPVNIQ